MEKEDRPIQAQECFEHHMLLKGQLDRINHFLFGDRFDLLIISNML